MSITDDIKKASGLAIENFREHARVCFDYVHRSNIAGKAAAPGRQACAMVRCHWPAVILVLEQHFQNLTSKEKPMRSYPSDSPQAVSRLLCLTVISDGGGSPSEIAAIYRLSILDYAGIEDDVFDAVLRDLTADLPVTSEGLVKVETSMIDQCLAEIVRPDLRLRLWKAMWQLAYADDQFAHAEVALLHRATTAWGIEADAEGNGRLVGTRGA